MGTPLRGELTRTVSQVSLGRPNMEENIEKVQGLLSQMVRLSKQSSHPATGSSLPNITVTDGSAAPWSWTAAEAVSTEEALIPFLVHLAAARDDVDGISLCLAPKPATAIDAANCHDVSGRSPLHTAAINNSVKCASLLLENGALVHLRVRFQFSVTLIC